MKILRRVKLVPIVLAVICLGWLIYDLSTSPSYFEQDQYLPKSIEVHNMTDMSFLDTVISIGIQQQGLDSIFVDILPMSSYVSSLLDTGNDMEVRAYTYRVGEGFVISTKTMSRDEAIECVSHELIHLKQYYFGRLYIEDFRLVVWEGDTVEIGGINYMERPWEKEAYSESFELEQRIRAILYKTKE